MSAPPPRDADGAAAAAAARRLSRHARRVVLLLALPVLVLVALLAWRQYGEQRRALLDELTHEALARAQAVDVMARGTADSVAQLADVAARGWNRPNLRPPEADALAPRRPGDSYTTDALAPPLRADACLAITTALGPDDAARAAATLTRAAPMLPVGRALVRVQPRYRWSYLFSADRRLVTICPWADSADFVEKLGLASLRETLPGWFDYELFAGITPERDPERVARWTEPYVDAGGSGLMVSHTAPVYADGSFVAMTGLDVNLAVFDDLVRDGFDGRGSAWVVDRQGNVLAGTDVHAPELVNIDRRLPSGLAPADARRALDTPGVLVEAGGWVLVAHWTEHAPWAYLRALPEVDLQSRLWPRLLPFIGVGVVLCWVFLFSLWWLRRELIEPALALVNDLVELSRGGAGDARRLHPLWQPWRALVARVLAASDAARARESRSEAFKAAIVDNALAAIITADADGHIVEFNPAAEAMFGWRRGEAIGRLVSDVVVPPAHREGHLRGMRRLKDGGPARLMGQRLEMSAMRRDGREFPVEMMLTRIEIDGEGFYTANLVDLTERRATEDELDRQREALRQAEKLSAMGSLLACVAHELNNPLAIVMGRAALLESRCADPDLRGDAQSILGAAERCGRIVRTFLAMARQQPGQRGEVDLNQLVRGALDLLGYSLRTAGIRVELRLAPDLPLIDADADQLAQLVLNLLVNSQQALSLRDIRREIAVETGASRDSGQIWLRVIDSGPGVEPALRERIFDPFFTTKPEGVGTGVGLSVSRSIARQHGGDLVLEPSVVGAVFRLSLPLGGLGGAAGLGPDAASAAIGPADDDGAIRRVLVVDDEPEIAAMMRDMLEAGGYEIAIAEDGEVALEILGEARFEAVVSDLRMPGMDGPTLFRALRRRHPRLASRVVFVTGDTLSPAVEAFLAESGCGHLAKPFTAASLLALVRQTVEG
ncbi:PAS domain S-box protein [Derxia gummosa]|uniref:histidine kinase n=1 Tax=Derxia gummosa DSM 723 TaxID=1121388 RepID=A0A8B6X954_9BURK|nr:PAS domain S-box protein [Derxia gummosa]